MKFLIESISLFLYLIPFIIISFGIGHKVFKLFKFQISLLETFLFSIGIGFGIFIYAIFILGSVGLLYPIAFYILVLGVGLISINEFKVLIPSKAKKAKQIHRKPVNNSVPLFVNITLWVILSFVICKCLVIALTPAGLSWDAATYHLNIPKLYLVNHKFYSIPYNVWSNFPLNIEMLYLLFLGLKSACLAKLFHFVFAILILLWIYAFSVRYFTSQIGLLASVIFISNPVIIFEAGRAYIDLGLTFYCLIALYGLFFWFNSNNDKWLILTAIFSGLALGCKYTGASIIAAFIVGIVLKMMFLDKGKIMPMTKKLAIFCIIPFLFVLPWLIKSYLFTGNPIYPKFYKLFGGLYWDEELSQQLKVWMSGMGMGRGFLDYIKLPWDITIYGNPGHQFFDGTINPLGLIFIPFLLFLHSINRTIIYLLGLSLIVFIIWASGIVCPQKMRFLIPILPLISLISSYSIENIVLCGKYIRNLYNSIYIVIFIILLSIVIPYVHNIADNIQVIVGIEDRQAYLSRKFPPYNTFKYINEKLPDTAKLLFLWENRGYYCNRPYIANSFFEVSQVLKMVRKTQSAEGLLKKLKEMKITHVLLNRNLFVLFPIDENSIEFKITGEFLYKYAQQIYSNNNVDLFKIVENKKVI